VDLHDLKKLILFRIPLGTIAGVRVSLHWTLILLLVGMLALFHTQPRFALVLVLMILVSVLLHELGHCYGARRMGGKAEEVILWPLGGLAPVHVPVRPWPQFCTTALGPVVNVALSLVGGVLVIALTGTLRWPSEGLFALPFSAQAAWALLLLNASLALMNLAPAFPLDGGRMFHTALWPRLGFEKALRVAVLLAYGTALVAGGLGLWLHEVGLVALAAMIALGARQERKALEQGQGNQPGGSPPWAESLAFYESGEEEPRPGVIERWKEEGRRRRVVEDRERMASLRLRLDQVLCRVSDVGLDGLSSDELRFLEHASTELRRESG
jgi:Zn-dependent protease